MLASISYCLKCDDYFFISYISYYFCCISFYNYFLLSLYLLTSLYKSLTTFSNSNPLFNNYCLSNWPLVNSRFVLLNYSNISYRYLISLSINWWLCFNFLSNLFISCVILSIFYSFIFIYLFSLLCYCFYCFIIYCCFFIYYVNLFISSYRYYLIPIN